GSGGAHGEQVAVAGRPAAVFDEIVHAPHRIRICALLSPVDSMEFGTVRDELGVADSVLSKQLKVLVDGGYAQTTKARGESGRARVGAPSAGTSRRSASSPRSPDRNSPWTDSSLVPGLDPRQVRDAQQRAGAGDVADAVRAGLHHEAGVIPVRLEQRHPPGREP